MRPAETLRAYVNTWECDENDHLNVQFYFRHFEDAAAHLFAFAGVEAAARPLPRVRHVRYHRELRVDQSVVGHSHAAEDGSPRLVHVLRNTADGGIAATALDSYESLPEAVARTAAAGVPEAALPRSLGAEPAQTNGGDAFDGGFATYRGRLRAGECDRHGRPYDSAIIGRVSDAATQFWTGIGVTPAWLAEQAAGRVAVEMKLTRGEGGGPDGLVDVHSRLEVVSRSTVSFAHRLVAIETGQVVATVETTALTMDLATRRANRFPEEVRERLEARIRAGRMEGAW
ncbi:acyl-CoA thioesterase [Lutibaculum baratangense]|uniref:Thioesterase n=1 Tax=Lutibaculum baratangense AMV1 TaxID=631454 RepID=V4TKS5_9HYPH|nr:thioesterase family protein [Lutibaculum baratangense]ESR26423.1 hypothetical protein N177_0923 [Lutibaculum baratangense AMV1]